MRARAGAGARPEPEGADREVPLECDLEGHGDTAAGAAGGPEPAVHLVAEWVGGGAEAAPEHQHGGRRRGVAPAGQVSSALEPFVKPPERITRQHRHRDLPIALTSNARVMGSVTVPTSA